MAHDAQAYRRSSRCDSGNCLEVGEVDSQVRIRSSVAPDAVLAVPRSDFVDWLAAVKRGEFDVPARAA